MQLSQYNISQLASVKVVRDPVAGAFARTPLRPDVYMGIEIEGEDAVVSTNMYAELNTLGWSVHGDDSLRHGGVEFVLSDPLNGDLLASAIYGMFQLRRDRELTWDPSPRAGTHFHINVSDKTVGFVQAFTALAYCLDELIFLVAGEDRRWCSYCNSMNTLPVNVLRSLLINREYEAYEGWAGAWPVSSRDRYYGVNLSAVSKFGTVELRHFPTPVREEQVWDWMDLCQILYTVAEEFENSETPAADVLDALQDPAAILSKFPMFSSIEDAAERVQAAAEELGTVLTFEEDHAGNAAVHTGVRATLPYLTEGPDLAAFIQAAGASMRASYFDDPDPSDDYEEL